ncbi:protein O-linked-mannose beta-1,2-N-acetylglucosaminyltransferase 1-like [Palaemon carinicauda]|uniref:protein O-linked-mannose beta-1,2-N-acetylglucosaminyltransferase 1-like n=1 Tax=Palaemon carinicauda TaxID=392227 RepID=UPI0035B5EDD9
MTPVDSSIRNKIKGLEEQSIDLSVTINSTSIVVSCNEKIIYERHGTPVNRIKPGANQSGVHLLVLRQHDGHLMMAQQYLTYQPAEHQRLVQTLKVLHPGRIFIVAGVPEWILFLSKAAEAALTLLGCRWVTRATPGEAWVCIGTTGLTTVAEGISIVGQQNYPSSALLLKTQIAKNTRDRKCPWYDIPNLQRQASFCESYEGYGDLCSCQKPFFPETRKIQPVLPMTEKIPVVVVTANKPLHLFRILRQLYMVPGSPQTDILVVVDGPHEETLRLAEVLQVNIRIHAQEGVHNSRTNANIKFALWSVFTTYPAASKAIILEDDLLVSQDILSFFHQTAPLLDMDPTVYCINAYSSNSFKDTASDPKTLLRARTYPMYGWMVTRRYTEEVIQKWVPEGVGDWDYWLAWEDLRRGRDVVFPEVSRTFHAGSSGVHVSGFEQETYFNRMIFNQQPDVKLNDITSVVREKYDQEMSRGIRLSQIVQPTGEICNLTWVKSIRGQSLVIYVDAFDANDKHSSYKILLMCFLTYDEGTREIYKGVIRLKWHSTPVYIVGCPYSPFCHLKPTNMTPYRPSARDLLLAADFRDTWEFQFFHQNPRLGRRPGAPLQEIFNLTDIGLSRPS